MKKLERINIAELVVDTKFRPIFWDVIKLNLADDIALISNGHVYKEIKISEYKNNFHQLKETL